MAPSVPRPPGAGAHARLTQLRHVGFDDPPQLARDARNEDEAMLHCRRVRDEIRAFVEGLPEAIAVAK